MIPEVDEWIKLDNRQKELNNELKQLREQKTLMSELITKHMLSSGIDHFAINDGTVLTLKTRVQLESINKEYIQETLTDFFKNNKQRTDNANQLAEQTTDVIINNRNSEEKSSLSRSKSKK